MQTSSSHDHSGHSHDHGSHSHAPTSFGRAFAIGITLNVVFVAIEAGYGFISNSTALLADAGHNLSDVLGLVVAWAAAIAGKKKSSEAYTYGFGSTSILAALFNALFLLVAVGMIAYEAIARFSEQAPVAGGTVMVVAFIGILINGITAWMFASGRKGDINIKGAYLHMAADAAVSAGVVIAGLAIMYTQWNWIDPVVSLAIAGLIVWSTWGLFKSALRLSLSAVPEGINYKAVAQYLASQPAVSAVHDLHIWPLSTTETALTCHIVIPTGHPGDDFLHNLAENLSHDFNIQHPTFQIETQNADCLVKKMHGH